MKKQNEKKELETEQSANGKETTIYVNPSTDFGFKRKKHFRKNYLGIFRFE